MGRCRFKKSAHPSPPLTKMAPPAFPPSSGMAAGVTQRRRPRSPAPIAPPRGSGAADWPIPGGGAAIGGRRGEAGRGLRAGEAGGPSCFAGVAAAAVPRAPGPALPGRGSAPSPGLHSASPGGRRLLLLPARAGGRAAEVGGFPPRRRSEAREREVGGGGGREALRRSGCSSRRRQESKPQVPDFPPEAVCHPGGFRFSFPGAGSLSSGKGRGRAEPVTGFPSGRGGDTA